MAKKRFQLSFSKEWTEHGEATIDADSIDEAKEIADRMLLDGDDAITWDGSNMDPGQETVTVKEITNETSE